MKAMRASRVLLLLAAGALVGLSIFGMLVYRAVQVEQVNPSEALTRFDAARALFVNHVPMLEIDEAGRVVPRAVSEHTGIHTLKSFHVLAYRRADERLVAARVPFWFFRVKRPAAQFAVRGTGLDLDQLQLSAETLSRHGPGLVLDHLRQNGERLLVWTE